jgi:hypothetical protein
MPGITHMSHMRDSRGLDPAGRPAGAKAPTQRGRGRHGAVAAIALCVLAEGGACATARSPPGMGASIDFEDVAGQRGTLEGLRGRVVVIDLCASWATACNLNAKVLDEVQLALADEPVDIVTLLVDEPGPMGRVALQSYIETLGVAHPVFLAGSRVRAGTSALGEPSYVPRIVVLDADGRVVLDDSGGVVSVQGLIDRLRPHLRARP